MHGYLKHDASWVEPHPNPQPLGVHGNSMEFNTSNKPAVREHCGGGLSNNQLFVYAGVTMNPSGTGMGDNADLWVYDIPSNQWAWVTDYGNQPNYSNQGSESQSAHPGQRNRMASATDPQGNIWFFGGQHRENNQDYQRNDIWKLNPNTKKWTWVGGPSNLDDNGNNDWPPYIHIVPWFDNQGTMWMYGGAHDNGGMRRSFNDLWKYNTNTNQWTQKHALYKR